MAPSAVQCTAMSPTPERSFGRAGMGLLLLYGLLPVLFGFFNLAEWKSESPFLILFGTLALLGGTVMVTSGLWAMVTLGRSRLALWTGGIASLFNAVNLAWVVLTDVLPCSGPD